MHSYIYIYTVYIYIERDRQRDIERERRKERKREREKARKRERERQRESLLCKPCVKKSQDQHEMGSTMAQHTTNTMYSVTGVIKAWSVAPCLYVMSCIILLDIINHVYTPRLEYIYIYIYMYM